MRVNRTPLPLSERGSYLLEFSLLLPIATGLALGIVDILNILSAYSHFKQLAVTALRPATGITATAETTTEHSTPRYAWYRYRFEQGALHGGTSPVSFGSHPPQECFSDLRTSCSAEATGTASRTISGKAEIDTTSIQNQIALDRMSLALLGRVKQPCNIDRDAGCVQSEVSDVKAEGFSHGQLRITIVANIPVQFLKYLFMPFNNRDFIQIQSTAIRQLESNFARQEPLILNNGFGSKF